ncbi:MULTISPECIES: ABC transporter substrate-binding protein [unclassified Paenibacillus]|uniref:ABC transporter substrate-binding protein n=1 Tax=unclassified Paenibacillus TaxID=185978 RepID=UPI001C127AF8|nr:MULTISPECIES: ABC transporter substrate-binding protein [unclassified Paenibacillus]MBU5442583.1 ABC transporter substrate-binding protein [Paenibacillus sp. MSJ-34]CAH0119037.1 hypothetical protein PAE9249_01534 [Paenibacillus sp. CECT 9249]
MKFKLTLIALLSAILVIVAGCSGSGSGGSEPNGSTGETNTQSESQTGSGETGQSGEPAKTVNIGIIQYVEHPSLNAAREGFEAALKDAGYIDGQTAKIDFQNAQNDAGINTSIAQKFASDKKDLVLAIATPSAQAAAQAMKDTPILFTAVTDPVDAGLVQSMESPGGNVTGTADLHPDAVPKLMEFIKNQFPNVETVGIITNEGEANSAVNVQIAADSLEKLGLKVVKAPVVNSSDVKLAAESLVGKVQAMYVPSDNTIVSSLESVIQVAEKNKIPLFVPEKDSVKRGGFASYGFEYYDLGYTTGKMAVEILKNGKKPADVPASYPETLDLAINLEAGANQGIEVTDAIKAMVTKPENLFEKIERQ